MRYKICSKTTARPWEVRGETVTAATNACGAHLFAVYVIDMDENNDEEEEEEDDEEDADEED
jgi:hypothetical protein